MMNAYLYVGVASYDKAYLDVCRIHADRRIISSHRQLVAVGAAYCTDGALTLPMLWKLWIARYGHGTRYHAVAQYVTSRAF